MNRRTSLILILWCAACADPDESTSMDSADGDDGTIFCVPGDQKSCPCPGGQQGAQACFDDGSGWDMCECPDDSDGDTGSTEGDTTDGTDNTDEGASDTSTEGTDETGTSTDDTTNGSDETTGDTTGTSDTTDTGGTDSTTSGVACVGNLGEQGCPADACWEIVDDDPSVTNGVYWITGGGVTAFEVYCDTETDANGRRGFALVDNDATDGDVFTERSVGANTDPNVTQGSYLPAYAWSGQPEIMCVFNGGWRTFTSSHPHFLEYPTTTTYDMPTDSTFDFGVSNGTQEGAIRSNGTIVGNEGKLHLYTTTNPQVVFCACNSRTSNSGQNLMSTNSGSLGFGPQSAGSTTCSTWVR